MGMTGVEAATTEVWCRVGRKGGRARRMDSRKTPSVISAISPLSFPQSPFCHSRKTPSVIPAGFQRESIFRGNPGDGYDRASRMPGKRKDSGCPITTVGHDRERPLLLSCLPFLQSPSAIPAVPPLSFPPVFSGNPSSGRIQGEWHDKGVPDDVEEKGCWMPDYNRRA